jgi:hypothetical protein
MTDQNQIFTRTQYVREKLISHQDYHAQFVTDETLHAVANRFGVEQLREALERDRHLNTIPLSEWEALSFTELDGAPGPRYFRSWGAFRARIPFDRAAATAAAEGVTRATLVCIAKVAARMLVARTRIS